MKDRSIIPITLSVILSFAFVFVAANAVTTISTNIETAGTLSVSGVSTFSGALYASSTAMFDVAKITSGYGFALGSSASAPTTAVEGMIYYDSGNDVIKLYDGAAWYTVGTSTDGWTLSNYKAYTDSLNYYITVGTTTQSGLSTLTLEATSTVAIPLTIRAFTGQTADLLRIHDVAGTELFAIDATGNASTTGALTVGTLASTTQLKVTSLATMGNATTTGGLTVNTLASTSQLQIGSGTAIARVLHGTCNLSKVGSELPFVATSTLWHDCAVSGVTTADKVMIFLPYSGGANGQGGLVVAAARASSTAGYIGADIMNLTGAATSSYGQATTAVQYWIFK